MRHNLQGVPSRLALPADIITESDQQDYSGGNVSFELDEGLYSSLIALANELSLTPHLLTMATFQLLLHRMCGVDDLVVGTDVAGRQHEALEGLIGFFVNVLPMRSFFDKTGTFTDYVNQIKGNALNVYEHQDLPLDLIVDASGVERVKGANPLVQVLFVMNNVPSEELSVDSLTFEPLASENESSKFDFALFVEEYDKRLICNWTYARALFSEARITMLKESWLKLLQQIVENPSVILGDLVVENAAELSSQKNTMTRDMAASKKNKLSKFIKKGRKSRKKADDDVTA